MSRLLIGLVASAALLSQHGNQAVYATAGDPAGPVRSTDRQIIEVLQYGLEQSPSFRDVVATLEFLGRPVSVERGDCNHRGIRACLQVRAGGNLVVRVAPEQPIDTVVAQLAHALYHAVEIAKETTVTDDVSFRQFYDRTAEHACATPVDQCWETQAAVTFEALVARQLARRSSDALAPR